MIARLVAALFAVLLVAGCSQAPRTVTFHTDGNPEKLSAWGLFTVADGRIAPHEGMITYELNTPLFSDYAQKWRTVWMPRGVHATYRPTDAFDFPVGTIVTKTFYYTTPADAATPQTSANVVKMTPATYQDGVEGLDLKHVRLIETRLLIRRQSGWVALPYVWDADGRDATLARTGADVALTLDEGGGRKVAFNYAVPNQNQCAGCHAQDYRTRAIEPIGLKARHLNRDFPGEGGEVNQLRRLAAAGYLAGAPANGVPRNADWQDPRADTAAQARAYLDINCSHCHNRVGAARTSGLWLDAATVDPRLLGQCKPPVAAGRGTGDRPFDLVPGDPDQSILPYRLASTDPGEMMPELGRDIAHDEGVALVIRYIHTLKGACVAEKGPRR
ncbi:SO2930 family diheme c-type cytochrome [Sphingomonas sp.]|uniref:SO2930 family diheme c-type cytochrome n=1 Tax=Sphingomonas sp. TaxID=28214 RepID=UPI002B7E4C4C|nr:SO2930 family diheme c-type cytochrome [Sphingomonas sp.]HWK34669.1 SO2930 family diheme c-type cytochrome [Sphingomonas sp.]